MFNIAADDLHNIMQRHPDLICIDVRFLDENDDLPYPLPAHNIAWYTQEGLRDQDFSAKVRRIAGLDTPILVFCRNGYRSMEAAHLLRQGGFSQVYNLLGGCLDFAPRLIVDRYPRPANDMQVFCV